MTEQQQTGELFDIGYQPYDGPRAGRANALLALYVNGVRQVFGIGRGGRAKVLPALMGVVTVGMALILVVIPVAFSGGGEVNLPPVQQYFGGIILLLFLLASISAPELLIPDRRENVLSLYLVRPLGIFDYVTMRWLAFVSAVFILICIGLAVMIGVSYIGSTDPAERFRDEWTDIPLSIVAVAMIALFITTIPLALSTFFARRVYVAATLITCILLLNVVPGIFASPTCETVTTTRERDPATEEMVVTGTITSTEFGSPGLTESELAELNAPEGVTVTQECTALAGDAAGWLLLLAPDSAVTILIDWMFDSDRSAEIQQGDFWTPLIRDLPVIGVAGVYAALVLIPVGILWWRYRGFTQ